MLLLGTPAIPPTTEKISWVTQVITSYDGHEERHVVRLKPRLTYQINSPLLSKSAVDTLKGRGGLLRDEVQFFLWHAVYNGENRLATTRGHPWFFEFGTGVKIGHYVAGRGATVSDSVRGAGYIYPVLTGLIHGNIKYTIRKGSGLADIVYYVEQAIAPPSETNVPQIRVGGVNYEVLEMPTRTGFQQAVTQNQNYFDSVVGSYIGTTRWARPKLQWNYTVELFSPADVLKWKQFLFRRQGKYSPVALRDTDGRVVIMRLATDDVQLRHPLGYSTSSVPFVEVFV